MVALIAILALLVGLAASFTFSRGMQSNHLEAAAAPSSSGDIRYGESGKLATKFYSGQELADRLQPWLTPADGKKCRVEGLTTKVDERQAACLLEEVFVRRYNQVAERYSEMTNERNWKSALGTVQLKSTKMSGDIPAPEIAGAASSDVFELIKSPTTVLPAVDRERLRRLAAITSDSLDDWSLNDRPYGCADHIFRLYFASLPLHLGSVKESVVDLDSIVLERFKNGQRLFVATIRSAEPNGDANQITFSNPITAILTKTADKTTHTLTGYGLIETARDREQLEAFVFGDAVASRLSTMPDYTYSLSEARAADLGLFFRGIRHQARLLDASLASPAPSTVVARR